MIGKDLTSFFLFVIGENVKKGGERRSNEYGISAVFIKVFRKVSMKCICETFVLKEASLLRRD